MLCTRINLISKCKWNLFSTEYYICLNQILSNSHGSIWTPGHLLYLLASALPYMCITNSQWHLNMKANGLKCNDSLIFKHP